MATPCIFAQHTSKRDNAPGLLMCDFSYMISGTGLPDDLKLGDRSTQRGEMVGARREKKVARPRTKWSVV
ncbi:MAG: hypothetical protein ACERJ2_09820, partial [Filomicrobium sp.]